MNRTITLVLAGVALLAAAIGLFLLQDQPAVRTSELSLAERPTPERSPTRLPPRAGEDAEDTDAPPADETPMQRRRRERRAARAAAPAPERTSSGPLTDSERLQMRDAVHQDHVDEIVDEISVFAEQAGWDVEQTDLVIAEIELRMDRWVELRPLRRQGRSGRHEAREQLSTLRRESDERIAAAVGEADLAALNEAVWGGEKRRGPPRGF